jgi:hypothetical protein
MSAMAVCATVTWLVARGLFMSAFITDLAC